MKNLVLTFTLIVLSANSFAQFQVEPAKQYTYDPSQLLQKYSPTPQTYTPSQTYTPLTIPSSTSQEDKTITIINKSYSAKMVELYSLNTTTFAWEYLKTIRIPGGEEVSFSIGKYEYQYYYGYKVVDGLTTLVTKFSTYPVTLY